MAKGGVRTKGVDAPGNSAQNVSEGQKDSSASQSQNSNVLSLVGGLEEAILSGAEKELALVGGSPSLLARSVTDATSGKQDVEVLEIGSSSSDSSRDCSSSEAGSAVSSGAHSPFSSGTESCSVYGGEWNPDNVVTRGEGTMFWSFKPTASGGMPQARSKLHCT
jgi:hypothetical protein